MEDSRSVAGWMGSQEILTGQILTVDEVIAIVDAITAAELKKIAGECWWEKNSTWRQSGPSTRTGRGKTY